MKNNEKIIVGYIDFHGWQVTLRSMGQPKSTKKEVMLMRVNKKALRELLNILADLATIAGLILILIDRLG
jgi:hypothetical protein